MAEIIYDDGADLSLIQSKKVAIIGYGSQGHAHALNLKDSGVDVVVGLRPGSSSWAKAEAAGLEVKDVPEAVAEGDVVSILLPDQVQRYVYAEQVAPNLKEGAALLFAHGFNIRYGYIEVPTGHDVIMVAPKGPGHKVRETYTQGKGTPESSPSRLTLPVRLGTSFCPTPRQSAAPAPASSRPPSPKRPKRTSSASRLFCVAGFPT